MALFSEHCVLFVTLGMNRVHPLHSDLEGLCVRGKSKERITKCLGLIFADTAD